MKTSNRGIEFIKEAEGMCLKAYQCSAGKWTIGVGHTSAAGMPHVHEGMTINEREAIEILKSDLRSFEKVVMTLVFVKLKQSQFDALVSFVFNIGADAFRKSTLLKKLNNGDYSAVPSELARWNKVGGKVSKGLVNRRAREVALWVEDDWQADDAPNADQSEIKREVPPIITKENISFASGIVSTAAVPMASDSPPIQYALAAILVIGFSVGLLLFLKRRGA